MIHSRLFLAILGLPAILGFAALAYSPAFAANDSAGAQAMKKAPARELFRFVVPALEGGNISNADFKGKLLVVDVWGTWCGPCRQIVPHLVELYKKFKARGVEVVGISAEPATDYDTAVRRVREFAGEVGINYRLGMLNEEVYSEIQKVMHYEGEHFTVPTTIILDREGAIIARYPGYFFGQEKEISELISQRLAKESRVGGAP